MKMLQMEQLSIIEGLEPLVETQGDDEDDNIDLNDLDDAMLDMSMMQS
jgi:hypothetical protein